MAEGDEGLRAAAARGDAAQLQSLLAAGADACACDERGTTALIEAARFNQCECIRLLAAAIAAKAEAAAEAGSDGVDASDENNLTALSYAAHLGHAEATVELLAAGGGKLTVHLRSRHRACCFLPPIAQWCRPPPRSAMFGSSIRFAVV
eukprot:SAG31_NODE_8142_length_1512_cov_1.423213_1_plen_148_part_10